MTNTITRSEDSDIDVKIRKSAWYRSLYGYPRRKIEGHKNSAIFKFSWYFGRNYLLKFCWASNFYYIKKSINASFESPVYTPPWGSQNSIKVPGVRASNGSARTLNAQNILDLKRAQSIRFSKENSLLNWDCVSDFLISLLSEKIK